MLNLCFYILNNETVSGNFRIWSLDLILLKMKPCDELLDRGWILWVNGLGRT